MFNSVSRPMDLTKAYRCPCCRFKTLFGRAAFEICKVCFWEDDGQDDQDADIVRGGPNDSLSLRRERVNVAEFGACEGRSVSNIRKPLPDEL